MQLKLVKKARAVARRRRTVRPLEATVLLPVCLEVAVRKTVVANDRAGLGVAVLVRRALVAIAAVVVTVPCYATATAFNRMTVGIMRCAFTVVYHRVSCAGSKWSAHRTLLTGFGG